MEGDVAAREAESASLYRTLYPSRELVKDLAPFALAGHELRIAQGPEMVRHEALGEADPRDDRGDGGGSGEQHFDDLQPPLVAEEVEDLSAIGLALLVRQVPAGS